MDRCWLHFIGTPQEVAHHAAPIAGTLRYQITPPEQAEADLRPGDVAVFYSEHFDRFRSAVSELKERQVATLYLVDGILEWRNAWDNRPDEPACPFTMRPVLSHKVACIGNSQARVLASWGNADKIEVVGIPRFDQFTNQASASAARLTQRSQLAEDANSESVLRIMIVTAKVPGFTPIQIARTRQSLLDLNAWYTRNKQGSIARCPIHQRPVEFVWRLTAGLDRELGIENQTSDLTGLELINQLKQVDAVIATPSTAMLEAMLLGLPTASLDYHRTPSYLPTAWTINHPEGIDDVIAELINPPPSKSLFQRMQLDDALAFCPNPGQCPGQSPGQNVTATERLTTLIQSMYRVANQCIEAEKKLHFPPQLLSPIDSFRPSGFVFDHATLYESFSEFQQDDRVELQVELAQARREIKHLQKVLSDKQSELDLAHSIFAQIHNHPVAGPVVRLRQRILDWWRPTPSAGKVTK